MYTLVEGDTAVATGSQYFLERPPGLMRCASTYTMLCVPQWRERGGGRQADRQTDSQAGIALRLLASTVMGNQASPSAHQPRWQKPFLVMGYRA